MLVGVETGFHESLLIRERAFANPFATNSILRAVYMRRELIVSKIEFGYL